MKRLQKVLVALTITSSVAVPTNAIAAPACASYYCSDVLITLFNVMTDGNVYIDTDGPESALSCSLYGGSQMTLSASSNDRLYSFLLTAYAQKTRVQLRIDIGSTGCTIMYAY